MAIFIGTSGFNYPHWRGVFYPEGLPPARWLEFYARHFDAVELNVTFYRLPSKKAFEGWGERTPPGFAFALKGSRFITHIKRLRGAGDPLEIFLRRMKPLGGKAKAILWQLPPSFRRDRRNEARVGRFAAMLRRRGRLKHAFEFRHRGWYEPPPVPALMKPPFAPCRNDWPGLGAMDLSDPPFVYIRHHGTTGRYAGGYSTSQLREEAISIKDQASAGKDVLVFFNNDAEGHAVRDALRLREML